MPYSLNAQDAFVPVVDQEKRLVGIVTVDDALDVITEEATEDISYMNSVTPSDKPYLETNVFRIYLHRIPWLLILMIGATFTGLILNTLLKAWRVKNVRTDRFTHAKFAAAAMPRR